MDWARPIRILVQCSRYLSWWSNVAFFVAIVPLFSRDTEKSRKDEKSAENHRTSLSLFFECISQHH